MKTNMPNTSTENWKEWVRVLANSKNPHDIDLLIAKIGVLLATREKEIAEKVEEIRANLHNGEDAYSKVVALLYSLSDNTTL